MNLDGLKAFQSILSAIGISAQAVADWEAAYKEAHPDAAGIVDAFGAWLAPKLESAGVTALATSALADLKAALSAGKGPITDTTSPTSFA